MYYMLTYYINMLYNQFYSLLILLFFLKNPHWSEEEGWGQGERERGGSV